MGFFQNTTYKDSNTQRIKEESSNRKIEEEELSKGVVLQRWKDKHETEILRGVDVQLLS